MRPRGRPPYWYPVNLAKERQHVLAIQESQISRTDGSLCIFASVEFHNTGTTRAAIGLVLNLRTLDRPNGGEELH